MFVDGILYKYPQLRRALNELIPDRIITVSILHRDMTISTRSELGLLRLSWLINSSPTGHEIASLFSLVGFVRPGYTFVDVGANVGLYSVVIASLGEVVGFNVIAIEPNPRTAETLRKNLSPYRCATVVEGAASNYDGETSLLTGLSSGTFHVGNPRTDPNPQATSDSAYRVRCFRLDTLKTLGSQRLVFKIDVEGHETEVFEGLQGVLETGRVSALMIDGFKDRSIPERLTLLGFKLFEGRSLRPYKDQFNLLAVHSSEIRQR